MRKSSQVSKAEIRQQMQRQRKALLPGDIENKSREIASRATHLDLFQAAETILVYRALPEEVQTGQIIELARQVGKHLCVPYLEDVQKDLQVAQWPEEPENWIAGPFGILQPKAARIIPAEALDLVLTPGLAFDNCGGRLGYGKGYFDRLFASTRPDCFRLGLAFDFQVIDEVPMSPDDQVLNGVVTEKRTLLRAS